MTTENLQKFAPQNLKNLTAEDVKELCSLNADELAELAKEYPNSVNPKMYLLTVKEEPNKTHIPFGDTYQNFISRVNTGMKNYRVVGVRHGLTHGIEHPNQIAKVGVEEVVNMGVVEPVTMPSAEATAAVVADAAQVAESAEPVEPKEEYQEHIVTEADLVNNPELVKEGIKVGDVIEIPVKDDKAAPVVAEKIETPKQTAIPAPKVEAPKGNKTGPKPKK